jgi:hypothetical protein
MFGCKEKKMVDYSVFPPKPIEIPFTKDLIIHMFPVVREYSIGLVYGERWAIAKISNSDIHLDNFPEDEYSIPLGKALPQKDEEFLFISGPKSVDLLNWKYKRHAGNFMDISKSIGIGIKRSKVLEYKNGIVLSEFYYDDDRMDFHFSFVIDDVIHKKRLKDFAIPNDFTNEFPVYFTPSYIIFRYNYKTPWRALDNDLNPTTHPLVDLLNKDQSNSVFAVLNDNMLVSEELKHAFIVSYNQVVKKDMLYLASWYGDPKVVPIAWDTAGLGKRRLLTTPMRNTMSPSGKWAYFATKGEWGLPATHYIIYLDPALPNGYLPPFKLGIEGDVTCASWMTKPEGLVLYMNSKLLYFDLSHFDAKKYFPAK